MEEQAPFPHVAEHRAFAQELVWEGDFDGRFPDQDHAIGLFEEHNAAVRSTIDPERLLVYRVGEGWEPLCDFLGVDVPDEPFPHTNDSAAFREMVEGHADGR